MSEAWWERHGPRLPSHGIKAHTRRGSFGKTWWASRWIEALEQLVNPGRLARGRAYARAGQVVSLEVDRGRVRAVVQGSRPKPYRVSMSFTLLSDADWERIIDAMAAEALYAARLLSGEMPEHIQDVFIQAGCSLFPTDSRDMRTQCSCPDVANPCKHIAAVHYLLGERFDEDPFQMFVLRGRTKDEIIAALRARRGGADIESGEGGVEEAGAEIDLTRFWTAPKDAAEVALHFALPESDALAVKRLGPAPFARDQAAFLGALERMYRRISEYALQLAIGE